MATEYVQPDLSLFGDDHVERYRATDGAVGGTWNGAPALLLTTTGVRSGRARTVPLIYGRRGDDYLVVASVGGAARHPAWYHNLRTHPRCEIQVMAKRLPVMARTAAAEEKPDLWSRMTAIWPNYDEYQRRTTRNIPVVVLSPVEPRG